MQSGWNPKKRESKKEKEKKKRKLDEFWIGQILKFQVNNMSELFC